jgi:hypothetical protein
MSSNLINTQTQTFPPTSRYASGNRIAQDVNVVADESIRDVSGRLKVTEHQNIYDADFEYGSQPLRWESFTYGAGTITHLPGIGGVRLRVTSAAGDITIRQSRGYMRYQPGKTMYMASAVNFGTANTGQVQRVGFFDDSNGIFFEQGDPTTTNPYGMFVCVRSDGSYNTNVSNTRISLENWICGSVISNGINWNALQMIWMDFAWYGAGAVRFGVVVDGEHILLHKIGFGNTTGNTLAWARTGNLPVRYEQRNISSSTANDMIHYGVSVLVDGKVDDQRGFTYSYGMAPQTPRRTVAANSVRTPVLSVRGRIMGTQEYTQASAASTGGTTSTLVASSATWTVNQWAGRFLNVLNAPIPTVASATAASTIGTITFASAHQLSVGQLVTIAGMAVTGYNGTWPVLSITSSTVVTVQLATTPATGATGTATANFVARIAYNTATTLTCVDFITNSTTPFPVALTSGLTYTIGLINRGLLLPRQLLISSSAIAVIEIIESTPTSPIVLTSPTFTALSTLGSSNSFAERDVVATGMTGGEVVMAFTAPLGGSGLQTLDLSNLFPLFNVMRGYNTDILTVAVTTPSATSADVGAHVICQEAMS